MNRVIAAAAALATAAAATTVLATAIGPAQAATHPAAHAKASAGKPSAAPAIRRLKAAPAAPTEIASEIDGGKYVTLVKCSGGTPPKPVRLAERDIPLTVHGTGSSPAIIAKLAKPNHYKTLYICTVTVQLQSPVTTVKKTKKKKISRSKQCVVCTKVVTLNTGFGGLAAEVAKHHPAK